MRIPGSNIVLPLPNALPQENPIQNLKPGQILQATALSDTQNSQLKLQIGVTRLIAQTQVAIKSGQQLTLSVEKGGKFPELRLLTTFSREQLQANALKMLLPRQQPLAQLFDKIAAQLSNTSSNPAPGNVRQAIDGLVGRLLSIDQPQFQQQLRTALQNSGLFTEAHLLQGSGNPADLKLNLLRLFELINTLLPGKGLNPQQSAAALIASDSSGTPLPADSPLRFLLDLLKQLDGGLARIQSNQLASLPQEDPTRQTWQFELPVRHIEQLDVFRIRLQKEPGKSGEKEDAVWSLTLRMNLEPLGPMRVQLRLQGEAISSVLWAEQAETTSLIKNNLEKLRSALEKAGLDVTKLEAYQGKSDSDEQLPRGLSLLDEKA
ncbi:flagellar hook-length control protein FliK [endosymbiont of Lamellibrachia barhami]|uniref:flagellar hook-length control protein FliK n=1 Tax=endosymbiont of Lamellibrachia barhami TaxID=205975 RepID=UPI0015AD31FF|nr:flagellar hook-length control protein FliK [endosymbiont of Lamellibrachia barhami]